MTVRSVSLGLFFGGFLLLAGHSAQAALIDRGSSLLDDDTGLEWLDLTETIGLSINDVLTGGAGGFAAAGYTLATIGQVETLWVNAGFVTPGGSTLNRAAGELLISLMGCTDPNTSQGCTVGPFTGSSTDVSSGLALRADLNIPLLGVVSIGGPGSPATAAAQFVGSAGFDTRSDVSGIFLVRTGSINELPEPGTFSLLCLSVAGLGFAHRWGKLRRS